MLEELQELNPIQPTGSRQSHHHQWFKPDPGYVMLKQHIGVVMALMRASANWTAFRRAFQCAFLKLRDQLELEV